MVDIVDVKKLEKQLTKEAKLDAEVVSEAQKALDHIKHAEMKLKKAEAKAERALEKARKVAKDAEEQLNNAKYTLEEKADMAKEAEENLLMMKEHEAQILAEEEAKQSELDKIMHQKEELDKERDIRLASAQRLRRGSMEQSQSDHNTRFSLSLLRPSASISMSPENSHDGTGVPMSRRLSITKDGSSPTSTRRRFSLTGHNRPTILPQTSQEGPAAGVGVPMSRRTSVGNGELEASRSPGRRRFSISSVRKPSLDAVA